MVVRQALIHLSTYPPIHSSTQIFVRQAHLSTFYFLLSTFNFLLSTFYFTNSLYTITQLNSYTTSRLRSKTRKNHPYGRPSGTYPLIHPSTHPPKYSSVRLTFHLSPFYFHLSTFNFLLSTFYFLLSTFYFLLSTFYFLLSTFYFQLSTFYFLLSTFYFLLSTFYFLLYKLPPSSQQSKMQKVRSPMQKDYKRFQKCELLDTSIMAIADATTNLQKAHY